MLKIELPVYLSEKYFGVELINYIYFLLIAAGGFLLAKFTYWVIQKWVKRITAKSATELDDLIVDMVEEPAVVFVVLFFVNFGWNVFLADGINTTVSTYFGHATYMIMVLNAAWLISRLLNAIIDNVLKPIVRKSETDLDDYLLPIISKAITIITFAVAIIMILQQFGQEIGPMLAGLGIGGLAFALAAKDLLSNLFGSITILFDKPFSLNHRIRIAGYDGSVKEINLRTTRIETLDGTILYVPNYKFTNDIVENVSQEWARKVKMNIGLTYDTSFEKMQEAKDIISGIIKNHKGVSQKDDPFVHFLEFGDFSKNILVIYWITDKSRIFPIRDEINMQIMKQLESAGIEMAFPTQTIELKK